MARSIAAVLVIVGSVAVGTPAAARAGATGADATPRWLAGTARRACGAELVQLPRTVQRRGGAAMVQVDEGPIAMGSAADDTAADADETPQHPVELSAFWIDRTEVTNEMFARFVAATGYRTSAESIGYSHGFVHVGGGEVVYARLAGADWRHPTGPGSDIAARDAFPVAHVSWFDAHDYCEWAGARLPREAEWEKAARGADGRTWPWGDGAPTGARVNLADRRSELAWREVAIDDGYAGSAPVGSFPSGASPFGALDMAGNVWEWVSDWYGETYYALPSADGAIGAWDPTGPLAGTERVIRGGSYADDGAHVRSARRTRDDAPHTSLDGGFRCVVAASPDQVRLPIVGGGRRTPVPTPQPTSRTTRTSPAPTSVATATPPPTPTDVACDPVPSGGYGDLTIEGAASSIPAARHPDLNISLRGWRETGARRCVVDYQGDTDRCAPKLRGILGGVPWFASTYRVYAWNWSIERPSGQVEGPWEVSLVGLATEPCRLVSVPDTGPSCRRIGAPYTVLVLYADDDSVTLKYTREDSAVRGYTLHLERLLVDDALLRLYRERDRAGRRSLPALRAGQPFARARGNQVLVSIRDTGQWMDPRSRKDWWPGERDPNPGCPGLVDARRHVTHGLADQEQPAR